MPTNFAVGGAEVATQSTWNRCLLTESIASARSTYSQFSAPATSYTNHRHKHIIGLPHWQIGTKHKATYTQYDNCRPEHPWDQLPTLRCLIVHARKSMIMRCLPTLLLSTKWPTFHRLLTLGRFTHVSHRSSEEQPFGTAFSILDITWTDLDRFSSFWHTSSYYS